MTKTLTRISGFGILLWLIVAIFYGLDYLQHTIPSVLILPISHQVGLHFSRVADILSIYFPVYAIAQIPAGYLMDRYGLKITLPLACLLVSLGLVLMQVSSVSALFLGRILIGIGSAFAFVGGLKAASLWLPERIFPLMVGLLQTVGVMGGLFGQVFMNYLINQLGWQTAVIHLSTFGYFWALILWLIFRKTKTNRPCSLTKSFEGVGTILKTPTLWLLAFYAVLMVGVVMSTFAETYSVVLLQKLKHLTSQDAAWLSSLIFVGVGVGAPVHGLIVTRMRKPSFWVLLMAVATWLVYTVMSWVLPHTISKYTLSLLFFLLGFFVSSMLLCFSLARKLFSKEHHAAVFALINTLIGLGGFFFPLLFDGLLHDTIHVAGINAHLALAVQILSLPLLIAVFLAYIANRRLYHH